MATHNTNGSTHNLVFSIQKEKNLRPLNQSNPIRAELELAEFTRKRYVWTFGSLATLHIEKKKRILSNLMRQASKK